MHKLSPKELSKLTLTSQTRKGKYEAYTSALLTLEQGEALLLTLGELEILATTKKQKADPRITVNGIVATLWKYRSNGRKFSTATVEGSNQFVIIRTK